MKKALAILMVLALVASAVTAEVAIGAWGRGIFLPAMSDGEDTFTDTAPSWGGWAGDEARIGFTIAGKSDNVGFVIDGNVDGGAFSMGDNQFIWVKPVEMLTVRMGNIYDDTLRGNAAFGSFNWYRGLGNADGEDITFSRIGMNRTREGFEIALKPMDALYAAVYFFDLDKNLTENLIANMQFAVGYTVDGVGQFKGQIMRDAATYDADGSADVVGTRIELAFNLTMIENLFVEAGFGMETNADVDPTEAKKIAIYANYKMDAITLHLSSINVVADGDVGYKAIFGVDYSMDGGIGISGDASYAGTTVSGVDGVFTVFAGVTKGFSNGLIGAGLQVKNDGTDTFWGLPIRMEYWF